MDMRAETACRDPAEHLLHLRAGLCGLCREEMAVVGPDHRGRLDQQDIGPGHGKDAAGEADDNGAAAGHDQAKPGYHRNHPGDGRNPEGMVFLGVDLEGAQPDSRFGLGVADMAEKQGANAQNNQNRA